MTREEAIAMLSDIRSDYNCFDENEEPKYHALSMAIEALKSESTMGQVIVDVSINKPTERWDTCGLSENDILVDSGARGERR